MSASATVLAEKLVKTVARAFYTDNVVVILDALVREKYIRDEELGPRLKLSNKDVRKVINGLKDELLVKSETLTMEDGRTSECWYVDYQHFVHVVRYRIHLMQSQLASKEKNELNHISFQCPTCKTLYSELQAQMLLSKDYKFVCSNCCPHDDIKSTISQPSYRLVEYESGGQLTEVQKLEIKMREQFTSSVLHTGIYDLLVELRDESITRNLPSDNIKRGLKTSRVVDDDVLQRIEENRGTVSTRRKGKSSVHEDEFTVEIVGDDHGEQRDVKVDFPEDKDEKKESNLPTFLQGSRVLPAGKSTETEAADSARDVIAEQKATTNEDEDEEEDEWED